MGRNDGYRSRRIRQTSPTSTPAYKFWKQKLRITRIWNHECTRIDTNKEEMVHEKHERHEKEQSSPFRVFSCLPWTKNSCGCVVKTIPEPTPAHKIRKQNSSTLSTRPGQNFGLQAMFPFNTRRGNQRRQNAGVRSTSKVKISRRPSNMAKQRIHLAGSCRSA